MFNRFDIAEAYYFYLSENHEGQFSEKYHRLSKLLKWFKPSPTFNRDRLSENAQIILENLENV
jgi:sarcosine oxidase delta subunit